MWSAKLKSNGKGGPIVDDDSPEALAKFWTNYYSHIIRIAKNPGLANSGIKLVRYEDLVRDYEAVLLGALDHLGLRPREGLLPIRPPRTERQSDHLTEIAMANYRGRDARSRDRLSLAGAAQH